MKITRRQKEIENIVTQMTGQLGLGMKQAGQRFSIYSAEQEVIMKITKKNLRNIVEQSMGLTGEPQSLYDGWTAPEKASYDEGKQQGRHDVIEQFGPGKVIRSMFSSQEEYDSFVMGYEDGYYG